MGCPREVFSYLDLIANSYKTEFKCLNKFTKIRKKYTKLAFSTTYCTLDRVSLTRYCFVERIASNKRMNKLFTQVSLDFYCLD